jgi:hypothetical protein
MAADGSSRTFYHGTRPSLISKILQEGLDPKYMGTGMEGWPDGRDRPAVSLTTNPHHAQSYMNLGAREDAEGVVNNIKALLGIGVPKSLVVHVPEGKVEMSEVVSAGQHGGFDEWHAYGRIDPQYIKQSAALPDKLMLNRDRLVNPDKLMLARDRFRRAAKLLIEKKGAVSPVGQRVFGQLYKGITAPPLAARGRSLLNASRTATQMGVPNVAQHVQGFKQMYPDIMTAMRNHPLGQHMDDSALVQNFMMSHRGGSVHDTARSLGLMGGPSHSAMIQQARQAQLGSVARPVGAMPTVASPATRQQLGVSPTIAGPRPMPQPAVTKMGSVVNYAGALGKLAELAEDGEHKLQGHIDFQGLDIAVENRKGSVRSGKTPDGHEWHTKMLVPYGYVVAPAKGRDGESIDCYVGPDKDAPIAYVVHQHKPDGTGHDEDKLILGTDSEQQAKKLYLQHYDDPRFLGPIDAVPVDRLKEMVAEPKKIDKIAGSIGMPAAPTQDVKSLVQRWKAPIAAAPAVRMPAGTPKP